MGQCIVNLDWNLPSLQYTTPSRTLSINFDPHGEIEEHDGDNDDHDEDREIIDLKLEKEALITESKYFWNQGDLRKRNYQYGTGYLDLILFWYFSLF